MLELAARRRKQFLAGADVVIHRTAHIQKQQHLDRVMPLRDHFQIQIASIARSRANGVIQVQFLGRALAGKAPQPAQRHFDIARAQFHRVVEIAKLAPVPDLDRAAMARLLLTDTDAFRVIAVGAKWRGARSPDPLVAALVPPFLLGHALGEGLHQLFPAAERFNQRLVFIAQG